MSHTPRTSSDRTQRSRRRVGRQGTPRRRLSTGTLTRRMLAGVLLAVLAFVAVDQIMLAVAPIATALAALLALARRSSSAPRHAAHGPRWSRPGRPACAYEARGSPTPFATRSPAWATIGPSMRISTAGGNRDPLESSLSLMLIDLDEFKQINDTRGHAAGDRVLRGFGPLRDFLRRTDRAFRVGGENSRCSPRIDLEGARMLARRLLAQALQPAMHHEDLSAAPSPRPLVAPRAGLTRPALLAGRPRAVRRQARRSHGRSSPTTSVVVPDEAGGRNSTSPRWPTSSPAAAQAVYQPIVVAVQRPILGVEGLIRPVIPRPRSPDSDRQFAAAKAGGEPAALDLAFIETIISQAPRELPPDQFLSLDLHARDAPASPVKRPRRSSALLGELRVPPARAPRASVPANVTRHSRTSNAPARTPRRACRRNQHSLLQATTTSVPATAGLRTARPT